MAYEQQVLLNRYLKLMETESYPVELEDLTLQMANRVKILMAVGVVSSLVGAVLVISPKILPVAVLVFLIANTGFIVTGAENYPRWFARVALLQPRDSPGITGTIYVYDNTLAENNVEGAFVCFRLVVLRIATIPYEAMEWVEAGFFENESGFWIFGGAFTLDKDYMKKPHLKFNGNNANGNLYLQCSIVVSDNKATAWLELSGTNIYFLPTPPDSGSNILFEADFNIEGDNLYQLGSESNDIQNTLTGHYASLKYYYDGWKPWQTIEIRYDSPYRVQMCSTDEFRTCRESTGSFGLGHGGGYFAMNDVRD